MKTILNAVIAAAMLSSAGAALAATADGTAGAKIVAPLQVAKKADLYFGTIAPSLTTADVVTVGFDGAKQCGPALTCLSTDETAASFAVTGEPDFSYIVTLPTATTISNGAGVQMDVVNFTGSKAAGLLVNGADNFEVGGTLKVAANQPAGKYTGTFTVAVEYQ